MNPPHKILEQHTTRSLLSYSVSQDKTFAHTKRGIMPNKKNVGRGARAGAIFCSQGTVFSAVTPKVDRMAMRCK